MFRSTDSRHPIFSRPEEYARFNELLPISLAACDTKLLGYCWLPESVHLVIEIGERPVADFMRDLMWRYSRSAWQRGEEDRPWFRERYHATLVQAETYLEGLTRYVHYLPVRAGLAASPSDYQYSSHPAYIGRRSKPPVRTRRLLGLMGCQGGDRTAYLRAMTEAPPPSSCKLFERGAPGTPGVIGDERFLSNSSIQRPRRATSAPARIIEKLIAEVAERQGVNVGEVCSRSRRRELVMARAQIVWLALRLNLGSLTNICRYLHHSPSAMSRAVSRYRNSRPELFTNSYFAAARLGAYDRPERTSSL